MPITQQYDLRCSACDNSFEFSTGDSYSTKVELVKAAKRQGWALNVKPWPGMPKEYYSGKDKRIDLCGGCKHDIPRKGEIIIHSISGVFFHLTKEHVVHPHIDKQAVRQMLKTFDAGVSIYTLGGYTATSCGYDDMQVGCQRFGPAAIRQIRLWATGKKHPTTKRRSR